MKKIKTIVSIFCCLFALWIPQNVYAMSKGHKDLLSTTMLISTIVAVRLGPILLAVSATGTSSVLTSYSVKMFAFDYIKANATAVASAITLGGGSSVEDLALVLGIPKQDVRGFGKHMRKNRQVLLACLDNIDDVDQLNTMVNILARYRLMRM